MKKPFCIISLVASVLLAGCLTTSITPPQEASAVHRLTNTMHVLVREGNYFDPTNLPPSEVKALFAKAVVIEPVLETFMDDQIFIQLRNGQVDLLICETNTNTAVFEDISCTPRLDIRWYERKDKTKTFTVSHPETCGCKK
jgi:hypothetical protein